MSTVQAPALSQPVASTHAGRRLPPAVQALLQNPRGLTVLLVLILLALASIAAPLITSVDPLTQNLSAANSPPGSPGYPLGTDNLGRDLFTRLLYAARVSLSMGIIAATFSAILGAALGLIAGYYQRAAGAVIMRLADLQFATPFLLVAIAIVAIFGTGFKNLLILLSIWGWATYARTIVASVTQVRQMEFVQAAVTEGARPWRILVRHILPQVAGPLIILWSNSAAILILAESSLSFIGLGVQAPMFSWGSMLAGGQSTLRTAWWVATFPGLMLMATVLLFNTLGDAIRDALNPQLRRGAGQGSRLG
jgi:peptide/nickel transport system permease protein